MNKKTMLITVALVAAILLVLGIWWLIRPAPDPFATNKPGELGRKAIYIEIVHADGSKKNITLLTKADYLGQVLYANGLIENDGADEGMFNVVDGEKADWETDKAYWALYDSEGYATHGVDVTPINDGDTFKLVYTVSKDH